MFRNKLFLLALHYIWNSTFSCSVLFPDMGHNKNLYCSEETEQQFKREQENKKHILEFCLLILESSVHMSLTLSILLSALC